MKIDIYNTSKKYKIIYADPPWSYKVWPKNNGTGRTAESHYKTMDVNDICDLPINIIADDNCVLLMWITGPCLQEGLKVIDAWGFKYKTIGFTWIKQNKTKQKTVCFGEWDIILEQMQNYVYWLQRENHCLELVEVFIK